MVAREASALPTSPTVEIYCPPVPGAVRFARLFPSLLAPSNGSPGLAARALGLLVVAPFTQLTFLCFDLQVFLLHVFHTRRLARWCHVVFMPTVNFFVMVALAQLRLGAHPVEHGFHGPSLTGATAYAALLCIWYLAAARAHRLYLWWACSAALTLGLSVAADAYYCATFTLDPVARGFFAPTPLVWNPFVWMWVAAFCIALSHIAEPQLPPRVGDPWRWTPPARYFFGNRDAPNGPLTVCARAALLSVQFLTGTINEWWASPRLAPYNLLLLMFRAGYRPDVGQTARGYAERALADGNPAIDFVGTGGGAFLPLD